MRADRHRRRQASTDCGSAAVEFVLIAVLLVFLLFAVLQVAVYAYVRTVVEASAADGARMAASAGATPASGGARAAALIGSALGTPAARRVVCTGEAAHDLPSGLASAVVRCRGKVAPILLPVGLSWEVDVRGMSLQERAP